MVRSISLSLRIASFLSPLCGIAFRFLKIPACTQCKRFTKTLLTFGCFANGSGPWSLGTGLAILGGVTGQPGVEVTSSWSSRTNAALRSFFSRNRLRDSKSLNVSMSRNVMSCSISLPNKRSKLQPIATCSFLANPGSFKRYTVRQSHQAKIPENFMPNTMTTPVRCPIVANCPKVLKTNGVGGRPIIASSMFLAAVNPSRTPCCAVGG